MSVHSDDSAWILDIVLGAPAVASVPSKGVLTSPAGQAYKILSKVGGTTRYTLYSCLLPNGRYGVLKIAKTVEENAVLDKEALILRMMREKALEVEGKRKPADKPYNYQLFFPELSESFLAKGQGDRRVNIFCFPEEVEIISQLTPLANLATVERVRVDPRTAAWIYGKMLKVIAFAHDLGISNQAITGSNVLIEREQHGVVVFDWVHAVLYPDGRVDSAAVFDDVATAAHLAITILGGNPEKGEIPPSDQLGDNRFREMLVRHARERVRSAAVAHDEFYELIYELWPRGFHLFTTIPIE